MHDEHSKKTYGFIPCIEKSQLELLTNRFKNKAGFIDTLFSSENNPGLYPEALNNFGVRVYNGLNKIPQDKLLARKIFARAHKNGSVWAIYNLAICLINDEPKDLNEAYRLFSLLLPEVRPSNYDFKNRDHIIYYFSGLYYFNLKDYEKAGKYFYLVSADSPHYEKARAKLAALPIPYMVHGSFWKVDADGKSTLSVDNPIVLIATPLQKQGKTI